MKTLSIIGAINIIDDFLKNPHAYIENINYQRNILSHAVVRTPDYLLEQISNLSAKDTSAIDELSNSLDLINGDFMNHLPREIHLSNKTITFRFLPIKRIGIYIPHKLPSSAYTFLSAAKAAGVSEIVLFIAQDNNGNLDPLTIYTARKYNAQIIGGPARVGFPILTFGLDQVMKCDLICGPCGENMNVLKNICALLGRTAIDMSAGASDLTIISYSTQSWEQIYFDLMSQLEHGIDSNAQLIVVGGPTKDSFNQSPWNTKIQSIDRAQILYANNPQEASDLVKSISPETLQIYSKDPSAFESCFSYCGLVYTNTSSTLGDYGVIGRGCADPTGGFARGQSGLSPLTFLKLVPIVSDNQMEFEKIQLAEFLANYENLSSHAVVLKNIFQNKYRT